MKYPDLSASQSITTSRNSLGCWFSQHYPGVLTGVWLSVVSAGIFALWNYGHQPGPQNTSPHRWPADSLIAAPAGNPVLIMFAHPQCPCTRATVRELERLIAKVHGRVEANVVFLLPEGLPRTWCATGLWNSAKGIPGVHVIIDEGGRECDRFAARTSGLVLLFSESNQLLFQGGITRSRGHEGPNDGIDALESILSNQPTAVRKTPVFGCALATPGR